MTPPLALVSRTPRHWLATASALRERQPELAAKITLARLAVRGEHPEELLTIAFTRAEYDRLLARVPARSRQKPGASGPAFGDDDVETAIADVEAFLGLRTSP